ncbi:MAG: hypothetical protein ACK5KU_06815 [Beutenbergiaceae bacterium]
MTEPEDGSLPEDFDFDAEFAKAFGDPSEPTPRAIVALALTPIASAPALAGVCSMAGIDAQVIPTSRGALAATVIERDTDSDMAELLGEAPQVAATMAGTLSRTSRYGAVLLISRLGDGDEGLVGSIAASQWLAGKRTDEQVSAGLVLAQADDIVEQLLFGMVAPQDAPDAIAPGKLPPWKARRLFRKSQRKPGP